jgi:hypothetical protein
VEKLFFLCGIDKLVSDCFFEAKLKSVATVIPNHPQSSRIIPNHPESSPIIPNHRARKDGWMKKRKNSCFLTLPPVVTPKGSLLKPEFCRK